MDDSDARWDDLVADLEAQAEAHDAAEDRATAGQLARGGLAELTLADRLRATVGHSVLVVARGAGPVRGVVRGVGERWLRIDDGPLEQLVVVAQIQSVVDPGPRASAAPVSPVERRWGIGHLLRAYARDRSTVRVVLDTGETVVGTLDAVGADHVEIAEHPAGEARRRGELVGRRLVPFAAIALVSRQQP